jgi:AAA domain/UvrD-like helicase C-terminal domain
MEYKQQEHAIILLEKWVESHHQIFVLSGYSGTGKSFVAGKFIEWYRSKYKQHQIAVVAPSHKAAKNIKSMCKGVEPTTIASLLGLTPQIDESTGVITFGAGRDNNKSISPGDYDLVVCDEYSMVLKADVANLNRDCTKILYLGDPAQLPPVGEDFSMVTKLDCPRYQLTDVVRYSGDLAKVAHSWRVDVPIDIGGGIKFGLKKISSPIPLATTDDRTIHSISKPKWILEYCEDVKNGVDSKLLTFTNKAADKWNSFIRDEIWDEKKPYNIGDKLICKKPLFRHSLTTNRLELALNNSTELTVVGEASLTAHAIHTSSYGYYRVPCKTEDNFPFDCLILTEESKLLQQLTLDSIKNEAVACKINSRRGGLWGRWHQLTKTFDDVSFAYALTTHKAQGSTYDSIYLDVPDLLKCRDKNRIVYTALTRSKQAYIYE